MSDKLCLRIPAARRHSRYRVCELRVSHSFSFLPLLKLTRIAARLLLFLFLSCYSIVHRARDKSTIDDSLDTRTTTTTTTMRSI